MEEINYVAELENLINRIKKGELDVDDVMTDDLMRQYKEINKNEEIENVK